MAEGFLGRWSQRKQAVRAGKSLEEPGTHGLQPLRPEPVIAAQAAIHGTNANPVAEQANQQVLESAVDPGLCRDDSPPPLTLEDAQVLTPQSNFAPFVARDVAPEVRNAAMKKLFADPHYNVMDRLDIYIDDYSKPDPLPESMLRQMASAKFLKLFEDEEESAEKDKARTPHSVAQSAQLPQTGADPLTENKPQEQGIDHDHTDLRLQPNHAAGPQEPGRSTE